MRRRYYACRAELDRSGASVVIGRPGMHDDKPRYELMALPPDSTYDEVAAVLGMPHPPFGYHVERDVQTPTRDGHLLSGDHYVPHTDRPKGTLLVRTPYGLTFPFTYVWSGIFAAHGYHVLFQSCRGTAGSSDVFQPMVREAQDAQDTVAWLREQSWFDGNLVTGGASYHAFTQYALLQDPPPELRASLIAMGPHDFGRVVFEHGVFQLQTWLDWSVRMAELERAIAAGGVEDAVARAELDAGALPLGDAADSLMHRDAPWYREWLRHTDLDDEFWAPYRATHALDRITTPVLLIGGWDDVFLDQTVETFTALRDRGVDTALTIGPWQHLDLVGRAAPTLIQESIAWLDHRLHGGPSDRSPLRLYVRGAQQWREHPEWPTAQSTWAVTGAGRLGQGQPTPQPPHAPTTPGERHPRSAADATPQRPDNSTTPLSKPATTSSCSPASRSVNHSTSSAFRTSKSRSASTTRTPTSSSASVTSTRTECRPTSPTASDASTPTSPPDDDKQCLSTWIPAPAASKPATGYACRSPAERTHGSHATSAPENHQNTEPQRTPHATPFTTTTRN